MRVIDRVVERLLALVQSRGLQAGQRLPAERQLAAELAVSRTSVREAIQQLSSQGVLASRRGDGTYLRSAAPAGWLQDAVAPLAPLIAADPHYRYDVLEARHALEGSTAGLAAQRATAQDRDRLRRAFDTMVEHQRHGRAEQAARADAQFHLAIAEASHNLVLVQVMQGLFGLVRSTVEHNRHAMFLPSAPQTLEALTDQHRRLLQAIVDGDAPAARAGMAEHLDFVRGAVRRLDEDAARRDRSGRLAPDAARPPSPIAAPSPS